jgi:hypothetical protein
MIVRYQPTSVAEAAELLALASRDPTRCKGKPCLDIDETDYRTIVRNCSAVLQGAFPGGFANADRLACEAWNKRMLGYKGPAQPSPALGDALNAGYCYLEVRCLGCDTHQTVALDIVRRRKCTPIHELERYMRCKDCSQVRGYPFKRSHLVALRSTKISALDPPSTWWPGER